MALYDSLSFVGYAELVASNAPSGFTPSSDPVSIILSTGVTQVVFSSAAVGRRCQTFMRTKKMYFLQASEDVIIISCEGTLLICEMTYMIQKMLNSYSFRYETLSTGSAEVLGVHRNLSQLGSVQDCLISCGWRHLGNNLSNNWDTETNLSDQHRPRLIVFNYYYVAQSGLTGSTGGSMLIDATPIQL